MEDDVYEMISKKLILDDCKTVFSIIKNIDDKEYSPVFYLQSITYLSFLCNGILDFYNINNVEEINIKETNLKKIINTMRAKVKMYSENKFKPKKGIENLKKIHLEFYNFFKRLYDNESCDLKSTGLMKLYDFGTFSISNKYIGNVYLDHWYLNEILDVTEIGTEESKKNIILFSKALGYILRSVCNKECVSKEAFPVINEISIEYKDFLLGDRNNRIFNNKYNLYVSLLLFTIICSINFVIYFLGKILTNDNQFYFRVKFICYYSSILSLRNLINYADNNPKIKTGIEDYISEIKKLEELKGSLGEKSKLRNCLLHYRINEEYIDKKEILTDTPFYGLIEKYTGESFYSFNYQLDNNLKNISLMLERWILN